MRRTIDSDGGKRGGNGSAALDISLIRRTASGDKEAFSALFTRYQRRIFAYFVKMLRNEAMAEELTNDVMIEVWRGAKNFQGRSACSTWIFGIAHNKGISALRKRREAPLDEGVAERIVDPAPSPAGRAQEKDVATILGKLLEDLSTEHREVIELTYYHQHSIREIAEIQDCPENTVKTRMFYARRQLKERLIEMGLTGEVLL
jgi:RNA polymerase sigma-70 factor (ECF subfamily)